jgi:2-amino-4-hydroxy-6-hydroxymethyldihydropteridine diphosphokinase
MPPSTTESHAPVQAFIGLGANLGDARATLEAALTALAALPHSTLRDASPVYRSAPIDSSGPDYLNAVVWLETWLDPQTLLAELQRIEQAHGRERPYHNAPRTLDLDLLLYGEQRIQSATLTVPHPRLHERAFVVRPLADVAPDVVVPGLGRAQDLLARVADQQADRLPS